MLIRTQVLFPQELLDQLRLEAAQKKTSVSKLVRVAMEQNIPEPKKKIPAAEAMLRMIKTAYKGNAPKDLSTNDTYLYKLS